MEWMKNLQNEKKYLGGTKRNEILNFAITMLCTLFTDSCIKMHYIRNSKVVILAFKLSGLF